MKLYGIPLHGLQPEEIERLLWSSGDTSITTLANHIASEASESASSDAWDEGEKSGREAGREEMQEIAARLAYRHLRALSRASDRLSRIQSQVEQAGLPQSDLYTATFAIEEVIAELDDYDHALLDSERAPEEDEKYEVEYRKQLASQPLPPLKPRKRR